MSSRPQSQRDPNGAGDKAVSRFIEDFALVLSGAGMPRMPARVFAALLVTQEDSLTAGELAETLQVSPAAISGAVRYLDQVNMVQRGREPGSRRDHYYLGDDFWYEAFGRNDTIYRQLADTLDTGVDAVGGDTRAGKRVADTRDFFNFLAKQLPVLIEQWREQRERGEQA